MKTLSIISTSLFLTLLFAHCGKSKTPDPVTPTPVVEIVIGPQTLTETKNTFQGKWKLHYSIGGFTGTMRTNYPNTILNFTTTDSIYVFNNNVLVVNSKVNYSYLPAYVAAYSTFILQIENTNNVMFSDYLAYSKKGDTLILVEPHTNPEKLYLTK